MLVCGPPHPLAGKAHGPISHTWRRQSERPGRSHLTSPVLCPTSPDKVGTSLLEETPTSYDQYKAGHRDSTLRVRSQARQLASHSHSFSLSLSSKLILFLTPHQLTSPQLTAKYSPLFLESQKPPLYLSTFISQSFQPKASCCSGISLTALKPVVVFFAGEGVCGGQGGVCM